MGTILRFLEEARAAYVAKALVSLGHGVIWEYKHPNIIITSCKRTKAKEIIKKNPGTEAEWWKVPELDCNENINKN